MATRGWRAHLSPFDWGALLSAAAALEGLLLLLLGAFLSDLETIAFGLVVGTTTALLFVRRNRLALLVRFVVFADVEYWMATAALSNLSHGAGVAAVVPPLALAVTSAVGLVASVLSLFPGRRIETRGPRAAVIGAVLVFCIGSAIAAIGVQSASHSAADTTLSMKNARYSATVLRAHSHAGRVTVSVTNRDLFWHTFTAPELGIDERFPVKAERTFTISAKPGVYRFYCTIPGHAQFGMKGTLTIQ
ncbi:MAG TPA: cupredoxin domain-containing protein [Candidatus Dormibacteraeota bacterium]|nr:cupredoxin domain-containing protein [Candidatus Dormibacteraeota bacterium]